MSFGTRIAEQRKAIGMTQATLAEELGVSFQTVSCWERDDTKPDLDRILPLSKALQMPVQELLEEKKEIPKDWEFHDRIFSEEHMYTFVKSAAVANNYTQTLKALPLMKELHQGQVRKGREQIPYINHPLMLACQSLAMNIADDTLLTVALMHDVCEDCDTCVNELPFDEKTREAISAIMHIKDRTISREEDLERYFSKVRKNKYAAIVKILDRCNNVSTMATGFTTLKISEYITETEKYVMPIIDEVRHKYPEYNNATFLLKYQIISVLESLKRTI